MSKAPEGKCDVLIRMDVALKLALAERARIERRSVPNLINYLAAEYLDRQARPKPFDGATAVKWMNEHLPNS